MGGRREKRGGEGWGNRREGGSGEEGSNVYLILGYSTNMDDYLTRISKSRDFQPHGKLLHVYTRNDVKYEVYKVRLKIQPQPRSTI